MIKYNHKSKKPKYYTTFKQTDNEVLTIKIGHLKNHKLKFKST